MGVGHVSRASEPEGGLAGLDAAWRVSAPGGALAGFDAVWSVSEPAGHWLVLMLPGPLEVAWTVLRLMSSSLAIRRWDQPLRCKEKMMSIVATLIRCDIVVLQGKGYFL